MKLGLGLYKSLLNDRNLRFAKQAGATHIVAQWVDYVKGDDSPSLTRNYLDGWGWTHNKNKPWTKEDLTDLRKLVESHGLTLAALENFDPAHWYDILLDGPEKIYQLELIKHNIRNAGLAGIPMVGYYFSLAGVWGWSVRKEGRGLPLTVGYDASAIDPDQPIPKGMVWNMKYETGEGFHEPVSEEEMWERLEEFLNAVMPVAEEHNVRLVAHPDDPPVKSLRKTGRLFYSTSQYEKLIDLYPSPNNGLELCLGTLQEMEHCDVYGFVEKHCKAGNIGYIHFRNVKGKVPDYREVFVDEGDLDMIRILKILKENQYEGVLIPDHTPEMTCPGPWHAGMAFALGFMRGAIQTMEHL
ncbi:MAG TPA: mannonate dehydratase [Saprospiraceae bacterium]|nr:mannonate dehydratase [Saprospiraceae bacterium]